MSYITQRQDRFYVVAYDGLDPLTGKERRRWHPAGHDRAEPETIASRLDAEWDVPPPKVGGPITVGEFLRRPNPPPLPALHLAAHTGMRRGEIVGLKWCDLDIAQRRLAIRRTLQCVGGQPVRVRRQDPHQPSQRRVRSRHRHPAATMAAAPPARRAPRRNRRLDVLQHRRPIPQPQSVSQLFDGILTDTDLPRVRFHDLRHTHASLLIASGEDVKVVSERLGHANPAFTMHTYQHLLPGMSAAAADRFATMVATVSRWTSTDPTPGNPGLSRPGTRVTEWLR